MRVDKWHSVALQSLAITGGNAYGATYTSVKGFSSLVELKTKKRNAPKCAGSLLKVTLDEWIYPRFEKLTTEVQEHRSHQ